jgi:hypothetical protein
LLLACAGLEDRSAAADQVLRAHDELDWAAFEALVVRHALHLLVTDQLRHVEAVPCGVRRRLEAGVRWRRALAVRALADLAQLADLLPDEGWAVLKGPVLSELVWSRPGLREFGDLDVLVDPEQVPRLVRRLSSSGLPLDLAEWEDLRTRVKNEATIRLWRGTPLDLHWDVLSSGERVPGKGFDVAAVLSRRQPATLGRGAVRCDAWRLDPVDTLLHVAVHSLRDGGFALRQAVDVAELLHRDGADPDEVLRRARERDLGLALAVVLQRTAAVRSPAPLDRRLRELTTARGWLRAMAVHDALSPIGRSRGNRVSIMAVRATRARSVESAGVLGREAAVRTARWLRRGGRRPSLPVPSRT